MRWLRRARPARTSRLIFGMVAVAMVLAVPGAAPAQATDARLEAVRERRAAVQERLDGVLARLEGLLAEVARVEDRVADLQAAAADHQATAREADQVLHARIVDAYKRGRKPTSLSLLGDGALADITERARLLTVLALRDQATSESAVSAKVRATATAADVASALEELDARRAELDDARTDVQAALADAKAEEDAVAQTIAAELAARERTARQRAARQGVTTVSAAASSATTSAAVSGGIACPVGTPRSYGDSWGAPRSGGRAHMGTDIMAPSGTPSYAYESGTISRMNSSSLGGISLYMTGDSGNLYYYTHLSGYAASSSPGKRVSAGELIAYVGDTGNAAGMPHLHFEVMPGGGSNVNPYPYVYRACG